MESKYYPKIGGTLGQACGLLAKGLGAVGAVIILYRGMKEKTETAMSLAPGLKMDAAAFEGLTNAILNDTYTTSISTPNQACIKLAAATDAECVILFLIEKDGAVRVSVSQPKPKDFVAAFALGIANGVLAMN